MLLVNHGLQMLLSVGPGESEGESFEGNGKCHPQRSIPYVTIQKDSVRIAHKTDSISTFLPLSPVFLLFGRLCEGPQGPGIAAGSHMRDSYGPPVEGDGFGRIRSWQARWYS